MVAKDLCLYIDIFTYAPVNICESDVIEISDFEISTYILAFLLEN